MPAGLSFLASLGGRLEVSRRDSSPGIISRRAQQCHDLCKRCAHPADSAATLSPSARWPLFWWESGDEHGRAVQQPHLPPASPCAGNTTVPQVSAWNRHDVFTRRTLLVTRHHNVRHCFSSAFLMNSEFPDPMLQILPSAKAYAGTTASMKGSD